MSDHRGRIWLDGDMWRYDCQGCDYGAGTMARTTVEWSPVSWLIKVANEHARRAA